MSTRSGKRIHHNSFHIENTMKPETDYTRSERKTRSKHTNDNMEELDVSRKIKKRNYVAYPAGDEAGGVDTVDSKVVEKKTRALRKNALKERNDPSPSENVEPPFESRKSMRSTRKTRKFDENSQDHPEVISQHEEPSKIKLLKPKKGKKKMVEEVAEVKVPKKKSKKKKGRSSGSIVVEDVELKAPSGLNKSNMSVDSFHSAAGSPRAAENCDDSIPILQKSLEQDPIKYSTPESNIIKAESRKTRSSGKLTNNTREESGLEREPRRRKSSVKLNLDSDLKVATPEKEDSNQGDTFNGEDLKRKSSIKNVISSEDTENSTFDLEKPNISERKSVKNATFEKIVTPTKINTTFDKDESKVTPILKNKRKSIINSMLDVIDDLKSPIEDDLTLEKDSAELGQNSKKRKSSANILIQLTDNSVLKSAKDIKKSVNETVEPDFKDDMNKRRSKINAKLSLTDNSPFKASPMKLFTEEAKIKSVVNSTFEKDLAIDSDSTNGKKSSIIDMTFDLTTSPFKPANEVSSPSKMTHENDLKRKSIINTTYEKESDTNQEKKHQTSANATFDKDVTETKINTTFEKDPKENTDSKHRRKSLQISTQATTESEVNSTFDIDQKKLDTTFDKNSKPSLTSSNDSMITLDKSDASRISITSDESKNEENILNTTPVLIESSMEVSAINTTVTPTKESTLTTECLPPVTPLKREGTFTKDEPEVMGSPKRSSLHTPTKRMSLPSAGFTPFHVKSSKEKSVLLNVTRSIEKRRSSLAEPPRATKVMFCSPVNNPAVIAQNRRKVIKSNLKGSNKSFVFDESVSLESRPARKRSYTQSDAEEARVKRTRLAGDLQLSVDRLSRPRTSSASAKLTEPTTPSKKPTTPSKKDAKQSRTKLPNFAALHQKQFDKMESLDECQQRKARRAKQLLTPTGAVTVLERISPKDKTAELEKPKEAPEKSKEAPKKPDTPIKSLPSFKSLNPGYTRFGFKLNLDVNPFSILSKTLPKPKENKPNVLNIQPTPSLAGATSLRRKVAKQTAMKEVLLNGKRNTERIENRTVIKGVRTNRRFELQMRMRDI